MGHKITVVHPPKIEQQGGITTQAVRQKEQISLRVDRHAQPEQLPLEEAYAKVPAVFRALRVIYSNVAMVPLEPIRTKPKDDPKKDNSTQAARKLTRLIQRPNVWMAGNDLIEWIGLWYNLREALVWMRFPSDAQFDGFRYDKPPIELRVLPPDRVDAELINGRLVSWNLKLADGRKISIPQQDIIRIAMPNPRNDVRGLGPASPLVQEADTSFAANIHASKFFDRGIKVSGVLSVEEKLGEAERAEMRNFLRSVYGGVENAEGVAIVSGGATFSPFTEVKDMDFENLLRYNDEQVGMATGVPTILLGRVENANRSNSQAQLRFFAETTLTPIWEDIAAKLTVGLAKHFTNAQDEATNGLLSLRLDFSKHPFLQQNRQEVAQTKQRN